MAFRTHTVLIVGAGQLGSRYLQGLSKCCTRLRIYVQDISQKSLSQAEHLWSEAGGPLTPHELSFLTEIKRCPPDVDLAIIATTAASRPEVLREITQHSKVRYWILEKLLAQSTEGLQTLQRYVGSESMAWVNTPRRSLIWHQEIGRRLCLHKPLELTVTGGPWGLACNAVHFLDLMAWWAGETLVSVHTDLLDDHWHKAKRVDNWEIYGTLRATYSGGATVILTSSGEGYPTYIYDVTDEGGIWHIDEEKGSAAYTDGSEILGHIPYQSNKTSTLVDGILGCGYCELPTLDISVDIHRVYINAMFDHWQRHQDAAATCVPIT